KKIKRPSKTSGRFVSPNVSRPLITVGHSLRCHARLRRIEPPSFRDGKRVAQEYRAFGSDQLADLDAFEDLPIAVILFADLDRAFGEPAAVGGDPHCHGTVALTHDAV